MCLGHLIWHFLSYPDHCLMPHTFSLSIQHPLLFESEKAHLSPSTFCFQSLRNPSLHFVFKFTVSHHQLGDTETEPGNAQKSQLSKFWFFHFYLFVFLSELLLIFWILDESEKSAWKNMIFCSFHFFVFYFYINWLLLACLNLKNNKKKYFVEHCKIGRNWLLRSLHTSQTNFWTVLQRERTEVGLVLALLGVC